MDLVQVASTLGLGRWAKIRRKPRPKKDEQADNVAAFRKRADETNRQRLLHSKDPDRYPLPEPEPAKPGGLLGGLTGRG